MDDIFAPVPQRATSRADLPRGFVDLRAIVATWVERRRLRWDLERKLTDDPYLIDDIGLTKRQAEAEIAKPFWKA